MGILTTKVLWKGYAKCHEHWHIVNSAEDASVGPRGLPLGERVAYTAHTTLRKGGIPIGAVVGNGRLCDTFSRFPGVVIIAVAEPFD